MNFKYIQNAIENDQKVKDKLSIRFPIINWKTFGRTQFDLVARIINTNVTEKVITNSTLVSESLILGKDFYYSLTEKYNLNSTDEFLNFLITNKTRLPFSWISGKTIQSYWNNGTAKQLKLNVLLVYLEIPINEWDDWKYGKPINKYNDSSLEENVGLPSSHNIIKDTSIYNNLTNYYTGSYFLYYIRTDNINKIVKAPFVIKNENGSIIAETCTENHRYVSYPAKMIEKNIYFLCKNLDWDEFESHLINIGLETKPEVLFGVSIALTVKEGLPVGIKNVFIKKSSNINHLDHITEKTIDIEGVGEDEEDRTIIKYFRQKIDTIHFASRSKSFEDFKEVVNSKTISSPT